jgi:hypothetical protein
MVKRVETHRKAWTIIENGDGKPIILRARFNN